MIQDKLGKTNKKRYGKIKKNLIAVYSTKTIYFITIFEPKKIVDRSSSATLITFFPN